GPARRGVIVEVLLARDELLAVDRCREEAAALVVGEEIDGQTREAVRLLQPAELAGREVQLVEPVREVGVVLEVARPLRDAVPPRAMEAAVRRRERSEQELAEPARRVEPIRALEDPRALGEGGKRQSVPRRDR